MPVFKYQAINKGREEVSGLVEAPNEDEAVNALEARGLQVIFVAKEEIKAVAQKTISFFGSGIKTKELVIFFRQFAVMVSAEVAVVQALRGIVDQTPNVKLKILISELADAIDGGSRLSDAMSAHYRVFTDFHVNVIRGGEASGHLAESLAYLADEMEKDYDMSSKIRGSMIYPAFVFFGLVAVGVVMMIFVVPKLTNILTESNVTLPMATRALIWSSGFMQTYWWFLLILAITAIIGLRLMAKTAGGKYVLDFLLLHTPIFGKLFQKIYIVRFARSMETLVTGGITITEALKITANVVNNRVYADLIYRTSKEVEDGNPMSATFSAHKQVPKIVTQMIGIGEKTGKLDIVLGRVSQFYTREINNTIANLMTLMEPIIMIVMGLAVGIMVAAIILPMYNLASQV